MDWLSVFAIAVALGMDTFAVAVAGGLILEPLTKRQVFRFGFHFGLFQAFMPVLGWLAGVAVYNNIKVFDHWIAFALLAFVGGKMIVEALRDKESERVIKDPTKGWSLVILSFATSIDALAVGLSLGILDKAIWIPALMFGAVTAALTVMGMLLGRRIGALWGRRVEVVGGLILIGIGAKILIEHLT
ncbi:MAG: manganese efflux pump MntP family protein [Candidatus Latescibacterota bacterium]